MSATLIRFPALLMAFATFLVVTVASAHTKIAVVDLQGALRQTTDGMRAAASLSSYTRKRQTDLDRRQKRLAREQDEIRRQARVLSRRAVQRRTEHWQRRMVDVQAKFIDYNKQLQKRQANLINPIMKRLFGAVRRAASRRGFDIVVDRSAVPYVRSDLDITDMVVQIYNAGGGDGASGDASSEKTKKSDK